MIPVIQSSDFCMKLDGVWLTNDVSQITAMYSVIYGYRLNSLQQIINILTASSKDLGVLLTCYYTTLGYQSYIVLGHTLYNGDTTFVLIKDEDAFFLINPQTGKKYLHNDTLCPLTKVYCLANSENV